MKFPQFQHLTHPLAFATRLPPVYGRVLMLGMALLLSVGLVSLASGPFDTLEEKLGALGWTLSPATGIEQRLTIVAIDERSIAEVGPWPWDRSQMARLTEALAAAKVQLQLHDIVYTEPKIGDDRLLAALQNSPGAVLAQVPVLQSEQNVQAGVMTHPLSGLGCNNTQSSTNRFLAAHGGFSAIPKGHITPLVASDGSIRKVPAVICVDGQPYPALAVSALLQATGARSWAAHIADGEGLFGPHQILMLDSYPGLRIPLDAQGNIRVSYQSSPGTYRAVSAVDVINGDIDPGMLENTWVLVGATAFGIGDIVPTPYSGMAPGVELQARLISSLLDTAVPYTPAAAPYMLIVMGGLLALGLLWLAGAGGRFAAYGLPSAALLFPLVAIVLHIQLLSSQNLWLGWLSPALFSLIAASLLLLLEQSRVRMERSRVFGNLTSYLPAEIAREIAYSLPSSSINAHRCQVTLLNADLRNFAAFSEARAPEEAAAVLHFFFSRAATIIEHHAGRIHEFKGDSLLAVWDGNDSGAASHALAAAIEMQRAVHQDVLPLYSPQGLEPLALGIGIEQGPVLMGSIGPSHRRTHTLLGDTVTIVLRIQELTADLAQPILLGECIARQLTGSGLQSQGSYLLNGLRIPHTLYAPPCLDQGERKQRPDQPSLRVLTGGRQ